MKVNLLAYLLAYLDKLEATANAAAPGDWKLGPEADGLTELFEINCESSETSPVADCMVKADADHILATQPRATLALIAKLREAVQLAADLSVDICEHPTAGVLVKSKLQRKIDALMEIEVPE